MTRSSTVLVRGVDRSETTELRLPLPRTACESTLHAALAAREGRCRLRQFAAGEAQGLFHEDVSIGAQGMPMTRGRV